MRWDFFRYLLDIHSLTVAASKDGDGGGPPEISGRHKDRDKSQPQLLSSRNLHHHQLIVSLSPSTTTNNGQHDQENDNNHSVEDYPSTDKKSAHHSPCSSGVTIIPSDPSMPSSSSSPAMKITTETNSTHSPPLINYNGNVSVDDSINQNVPVQRKAAFLISTSSPRSSSSLFPSSQHKESRRANGQPDCENYEARANNEEIHHPSLSPRIICSANHSKNNLLLPHCKESLRKVRANINLHNNGQGMDGAELNSNHNGSHHHSPSFEQNGNFNGSKSTPPLSSSSCACSHLSMSHHPQEQVQSPNFSSEKGIYSININETTLDVGNDKSHPSLKYYYDHYPSHCNSLSSSTDANNAEAEIVLGTRASHKNEQGLIIQSGAGGAIHVNGGGGDLIATEDEASSIASSFCSSSATIGGGGDALINVDGADVEFDIDAKTIKRSETSESNGSTTTSLSNPAENHLPIEDKPSALFSPSPVVSSSYNTLRWTKAVANQENLAQIRNLQQHHSLPRYLPHHHHQEGDHHHRQFHIPSGTIKKGREVEAYKKESAENDFLGDAAPFPSYNNAPTNTAISNIINTGTTCSSSVVATSTVKNDGGGSNEAMNGNRLNAATLLEEHPPLSRPTSIIGGNNVPSLPSSSRNNRLLVFQDKWRVLFDKFDHEGFGEITWTDFLLALRSKEFQLAIEPGKLQLLEDLATVHSKQTGSITFQFFVNILLNHRAREVNLPKPPGVLETEEPKTKKKLPTCNLIITRCNNLISPGQRFGAVHISRTNVTRGDGVVGGKLTRPRENDDDSSSIGGDANADKEVPEPMASTKKDKSLYKCSYCFRIYTSVDGLMQHLLNHQTNKAKLPKPPGLLKTEEPKTKEKKLPTCKLIITRCDNSISPDRSFGTIHNGGTNVRKGDDIDGGKLTKSRRHDLELGLANNSGIEKIGRRFSLKQILDCGSSTEVGRKPHKCQLCPKSFRQLGDLKIHIRTHTDERPYRCQLCSKSFGELGTLKRHIRTHTGERPHKCQFCSKWFREQGHLARHIRTHTGERPHQCQLCSKSFGQLGHLKTHIRTHTGERFYRCQLCSKSFARQDYLKTHIRTHTGERPHQCQLCSKSFGRQNVLEQHIRTHTGERPHQCQLCPKSFRQIGNLKRHIRTHTAKEDIDGDLTM